MIVVVLIVVLILRLGKEITFKSSFFSHSEPLGGVTTLFTRFTHFDFAIGTAMGSVYCPAPAKQKYAPFVRWGTEPLAQSRGLTLLEPQSRNGDKPVKFQVVCPQNETAVLKRLNAVYGENVDKPPPYFEVAPF